MLITKRGQGSSTVDGDKDGASSDDGFTEEFEKLQGDTNSLKIMQVEIETDEDKPEFVPFKTNNYDKEFTATTKAVTDNIYAALNQETFGRLRSGSIGFTGDLANDVKREYCEQVAKQQRMLSRAYRAIFSHWEPNTIPYTGAGDAAIEPLVKSIANDATLILPATACGLLATAVLNINNLRDINSDRENGKNTLVVRLGAVNARRYHACLLMGSLVCLALFNLFSLHSLWGWLFLLAAPLLVKQARYVMREMDPVAMRPMLERTVKGALLTNLLFVLGSASA